MFKQISEKFPADPDYPTRVNTLLLFKRVLEGTIYDNHDYSFLQEKDPYNGQRIPLRDRAPYIRYNLSKIVVEHSASLVFSDSLFPVVYTEDKSTRELFKNLVKDCDLSQIMFEAVIKGSIGSAAIRMRVFKSSPHFDLLDVEYCTPVWRKDAPDTLLKVISKRKYLGRDLAAEGYDIDKDDLDNSFWLQCIWCDKAETWFNPVKCTIDKKLQIFTPDKDRSYNHQIGVVPIVWIKNLRTQNTIDGICTFEAAINNQILIEYMLSQVARSHMYNSDPLIHIAGTLEAEMGDAPKPQNQSVIETPPDTTVNLLELKGTASDAVLQFVTTARDLAIESIRGNRLNPDKVNQGEISGRAIEMSLGPLLLLCNNLRNSYGERGLLPLIQLIIAASKNTLIKIRGQALSFEDSMHLTLKWPDYFSKTPYDRNQDAQTFQLLTKANLISEETALRYMAMDYDIEDVEAEIVRINAERDQRIKEQVQLKTMSLVNNNNDGQNSSNP